MLASLNEDDKIGSSSAVPSRLPTDEEGEGGDEMLLHCLDIGNAPWVGGRVAVRGRVSEAGRVG